MSGSPPQGYRLPDSTSLGPVLLQVKNIGEDEHEIDSVIDDLVAVRCEILTLGQYLQPSAKHLPVHRWVHPDEFTAWKIKGEARGIRHVESGPMVRSSYHAEKQVHAHAAVS